MKLHSSGTIVLCFLQVVVCIQKNDYLEVQSVGRRTEFTNHYCNKTILAKFVSQGCCSPDPLNSHCFLNDWETRDAFCETQNLHNNRFSYDCKMSVLHPDKNCTLPYGRCYCCSEKNSYPFEENKCNPTRNVTITPDQQYCGSLRSSHWGFQQTLADIYVGGEFNQSHFQAVVTAASGGTKSVTVSDSNCKIIICGIHDKYGEAICWHFYYDGINYFETDHNFTITSISCGCKGNATMSDNCFSSDQVTTVADTSNIGRTSTNTTMSDGNAMSKHTIDSVGEKDHQGCSSQNLINDATTCAVLFQEVACQNCFFKELRLPNGGRFVPGNNATIRSLAVKTGCQVKATSSNGGTIAFNSSTDAVPEFHDNLCINSTISSFDCSCTPESGGLQLSDVAMIIVLAASPPVLLLIHIIKRRKTKVIFTKKETDELKNELFGEVCETSIANGDNCSQTDIRGSGVDLKFCLRRQDIEQFKDQILGKGNYGLVYKGRLTQQSGDTLDVAIKTVDNRSASIEDLKLLLNEIRIMSVVGNHTNIVSFLGYYCNFHPRKWEFLCLMELCINNLHDHLLGLKRLRVPVLTSGTSNVLATLQSAGYVCYATDENTTENVAVDRNSITKSDMFKWATEIADGMEYLSNKKMIHIDLATRNILLADGLVAKIGDFGLSKKLYNTTYYRKLDGGKMLLPLKWSAFETLMSLSFSTQSDVWSYAVTVWEIFSLGDEPYSFISDILELLRYLNIGQRLPCPKYCDAETYEVLIRCWLLEPKERPVFSELNSYFRNKV